MALRINSNFTLNTTKKLLIYGGTVLWTANANLTIATNGTVTVTGYTGSYGLQTSGSSCNNNKVLIIGTVRYAACTGGGNVVYIFGDINSAGGSITAIPTAIPTAICQGSSTTLSGNYSGLIGSLPIYSWSGTGPGGYTFSSTLKNPGALTLNTPGTYTYNLTASTVTNGNTYSNTQSVTVTVASTSVGGTATASPSLICNSGTSTLTLTGYNGSIQWQESNDGSTNWTNVTTGTGGTTSSYITATLTSTKYYRAAVTNGVCPTVFSNIATVTIDVPTISGGNSVCVGQNLQLTGSGTPAASNPWTSSNTAVATVSAATGLVTGVSAGTTTITYTNNNGCSTSTTVTVTLNCFCYKPAQTTGTTLDTNHGITALGRAGADNSNWPMVRKGAWTVLEAKTKGFVVNRLTDAQISAIPSADLREGMMVYNINQDCLQINIDGTATGWKCFNTQTCPDL